MSTENQKNEIAIQLNNAVGSVLNQTNLQGFERAYATAKSIEVLKGLLSPEYMAPIMQLQGNRLGFKSDKDKSGGYPVEIVKNCLIEAVLMGLQPYGNQFNIIAGNTYPTKEGLGHVLNNWSGLKYSLICGVPRPQQDGKSAIIDVNIKWSLNGKDSSETIPIAVKMDAYTSVDALVGKATRKGRAWLLGAISGMEITDADVEDAEFLDVTPKKQSAQEVSKQKERDRVIKHIEVSKDIETLERCLPAIADDDEELIILFDDRKRELKTKK